MTEKIKWEKKKIGKCLLTLLLIISLASNAILYHQLNTTLQSNERIVAQLAKLEDGNKELGSQLEAYKKQIDDLNNQIVELSFASNEPGPAEEMQADAVEDNIEQEDEAAPVSTSGQGTVEQPRADNPVQNDSNHRPDTPGNWFWQPGFGWIDVNNPPSVLFGGTETDGREDGSHIVTGKGPIATDIVIGNVG